MSYFYSKFSSLLPGYVVVFVLQIGPERSFGTIFKNNAIVGIGGDCSQKHDDVGVSNRLHCMALAQKITKADLTIFYLEFLDNNWYLSPFSPIDNAVPTLTDLTLDLQLFPSNLSIRLEFSVLSNSIDLKFRCSLTLFTLFTGGLIFL